MESTTRMLVIGSVWPEPDSSAAGAHLMQILRPFLAAGWDVHFASTAAESEFAVDLDALGITAHAAHVNDSAFDVFLAELSPHIVLFDRFFIEEQFGWRVEEACPDALRVLNSEDLHFLREARRQNIVAGSDASPTPSAAQSEIARREIASILRSDLSLIISEFEIELLCRDFNIKPELLHYAPFMLDLDPIPDWPSFEERHDFVCIGNYRHAPNWDAVGWMAHEIWPRIRKELPEAKLRIYGAYPTPAQLSLHAPEHGLVIEGRVAQADVAFREARVCLAPLRFGAGLKGKIFDAMRAGTPTVTTPIGAEGIAGALPFAGKIAETPEALAEAAVSLYQEAETWEQKQASGRDILAGRFDRRTHEPSLRSAFQEARVEIAARRNRNFVGAMLRDQHHKSTRYLSLWIEAKNRLADKTPGPSRKNLLHSKWSATQPVNQEKHFQVTRVAGTKKGSADPPRVELEAVLTKRRFEVPLHELGNKERWVRGWV